MSRKTMLLRLLDSFSDFLFPRRCIMCGKRNPEGEFSYICDSCQKNIYLINGGKCLVCSEIIGSPNSPNFDGCPHCKKNPPNFIDSHVVCSFSGVAREIVHEMKYRDGAHLVGDISKIIKKSEGLSEFINNSILVPIPLHRSRTLKRRFNQSELIARAILKAFPESNASISDALVRTRRTATQTTLDKIARAENVRGAFAINTAKKISDLGKSSRIVIVDDVMTSGATLSESAKALISGGFKNVHAFAFAKRI